MSEEKQSENTPYRVLALKYRPQSFDELIGQAALVQTLRNAIDTGRIAHAFMLTGVRGVGKTTTARIIAKALNYKGADGSSGPTTGSTEDCPLCQAIAEDRHPDIIEMDAASRTGVDDIREILDGVRYAPVEARYKVYIIDEVHMLSKQAFNALLKTLEEPPEHVKFIFATTEIRKVPITVLSRCQRFDLRRVSQEELVGHFASICAKESVQADDEALALIGRAADGSVRDGLSLLDQAMALGGDGITADQVRAMLGLVDRARNMDLLEHALSGNMPDALEILDDLYAVGADPSVIIQDLLDLTHALTKFRAVPDSAKIKQTMGPEDIKRIEDVAGKLSMPTLAKTWQILLKGLPEVNMAANPGQAAEMVIIRLAYASDLPDPRDLIKKLKDGGAVSGSGGGAAAGSAPAPNAPSSAPVALQAVASGGGGPAPAPAPQTLPQENVETAQLVQNHPLETIEHVVEFLEAVDEIRLAGLVFSSVHLVRIEHKAESGRLEVRVRPEAPPTLTQELAKTLNTYHAKRWMVSVSDAAGAPTLAECEQAAEDALLAEVKEAPLVRAVFDYFPEAEIIEIKDHMDPEK